METTIFLAQLMGPVMIVMGIGILTSKDYYLKMYRNLENETLAVIMASMVVLPAGLAVVLNHNIWTSVPAGLVSFFGWALVIKGIALAIFPKVVENLVEKIGLASFLPGWGGIAIILGAYLTWFAYLA